MQFRANCNGQNVLLFITEGFIYCCCFLAHFIPRKNNENIVEIHKLQQVSKKLLETKVWI